MQPASPATIDTLLEHSQWVRALARRLVADPAGAQDLEQEVWRTALEHPPRDGSNLRGWLARVARNAAISLGRSGARREQRERSAARPEALPDSTELVAQAELTRELVAEVVALEEPYRSVLILRYWHGLSAGEIAARRNMPEDTVHTQLRRGHERLRERLDRRFGDRESWLAALAPLARLDGVRAGAAAGGLALFLTSAAAALLVACGLWWAWPARSTAAGGPWEEPGLVKTADREPEDHSRTSTPSDTQRNPVAPLLVAPLGAADLANGARRALVGRLLDLVGQPLAAAEIEWLPTGAQQTGRSTRTDAQGRFTLEVTSASGTPRPVDPRLAIAAELSQAGASDWTLIVAPCIRLEGRAVDAEGRPVRGVRLSSVVDLDRLDRLALPQARGRQRRSLGDAADDGRFALERVPVGAGIDLEAGAQGFAPRTIAGLAQDDLALELALEPTRALERPHLRGLVLDAQGTPSPHAQVSLGQDAGETDASGRFDFAVAPFHPGEALVATKPGAQAAVLEGFGSARTGAQEEILLRLGPPTLAIAGRVRLPDGSNPGRCRVQLLDGTPGGAGDGTAEDASAGRHQPGVDTDEQGRFVLDGLRARAYRLLAQSEVRGPIACTGPITAGSTDVLVQDPPSAFFARLQGRLRTRAGVPLSDAEVCLTTSLAQNSVGAAAVAFGRVRTDALGRFELHDVPRRCSRLSVSGAGILAQHFDLPESDAQPLELVVALQVRTRVRVADERIDRIEFRDAQDRPVWVEVEGPGLRSQEPDLRRAAGEFPVFRIVDRAETALLMQGTVPLRRAPIELRGTRLLELDL